jgi:hypothetical protein
MKEEATTPAEAIIRSFYADHQIRWNTRQFRSLAVILKLTDYELGAMVGLSQKETLTALRDNAFPLPVCILLELYHSYVLSQRLGEKPATHPLDKLHDLPRIA